LFGQPPAAAVAVGEVAAMLQSGGLLRDLTVRELVTMMASLYPAPLAVAAAIELAGLEGVARLVQAGRVALGGAAWPAQGWLVVALWSVALAALAGYAYRRDTQRV
jgi:hypothetical protein